MRVLNGARDHRHQLVARRGRGAEPARFRQAAASGKLHAEERQHIFALAHFIKWVERLMIQWAAAPLGGGNAPTFRESA